jgi:hypothetical protein
MTFYAGFWQPAHAAMFSQCSSDGFQLAIVSDHVAIVTGRGLCPVSASIL